MRDTLVEAVYENGAFRPLAPVALADSRRVRLTISDAKNGGRHPLIVPPDEWAQFADDDVTLEQVQEALSHMKGSLSQAVIDSRGEY